MDKGYAAWAARSRVPLGFAMSIAFVILSRPTFHLLVIGCGIALLGLLLRALAAGYLEKGRVLATTGPYRYTRNPLYLGSFFMGLGFAIASGHWVLVIAFLFFFLVIYWPVMLREERELRGRFGQSFDRYSESAPRFFPYSFVRSKINRGISSGEKFEWQRYQKNREYEAAIGYIVGVVILAVKLHLR